MPKSKAKAVDPDTTDAGAKKSTSRIRWAQLLKRVFGIDVESCQICQGPVKIIAAIEDPQVIEKILNHLGLPHKPPIPSPARGPPIAQDFDQQTHFEDPIDFPRPPLG